MNRDLSIMFLLAGGILAVLVVILIIAAVFREFQKQEFFEEVENLGYEKGMKREFKFLFGDTVPDSWCLTLEKKTIKSNICRNIMVSELMMRLLTIWAMSASGTRHWTRYASRPQNSKSSRKNAIRYFRCSTHLQLEEVPLKKCLCSLQKTLENLRPRLRHLFTDNSQKTFRERQ